MGVARAADEANRAKREELRLISLAANETSQPIMILDENRRIAYVNHAFSELFGYEPSEAVGRLPSEFLTSPRTDPETLRLLRQRAWGTDSFGMEILALDKRGRDIWLSSTANPIVDENGVVRNMVVILSDITENKEIDNLRCDMLEAMASGMSLPDVGDFLCRRVERMAPDILASILLVDDEKRLRPLSGPGLSDEYNAAVDGVKIGENIGTCGTAAYRGEPVLSIDIATDPRWEQFRSLALPIGLKACWSSPIVRRDGTVLGTFAFYFRENRGPGPWHHRIVDACLHLCMIAIEQSQARSRIAQLSHFDPLTGLPNRSRFQADVAQYCSDMSKGLAFLFLDVDRFRNVNEAMGHMAGDLLLIEVAERLRRICGDRETLYRLGGDEFLFILPSRNAARVTRRAEQLLAAFAEPVVITGTPLALSVSVGIGLSSAGEAFDADSLLKHAETALSQAKADGRAIYRFFGEEMNRVARDRLTLGAALKEALQRRKLELHFQPQVHTDVPELHGVEALTRWTDEALGPIPPDKFIPLAEELGLIGPLGHWALRESCRHISEWRRAGIRVPAVSVNISPLQFREPDFPSFVESVLDEFGLPPESLVLEITESVMMGGDPRVLDAVQSIGRMGVGLSMDDFGTGFSSLSNLHRLPIRELKIDRSFMQDLHQDESARALVTAVIRIGQSLGLTVVAEGVEDEIQRAILSELGCHVAQGYLFSRPLPEAEFVGWMRNRAAHWPKRCLPERDSPVESRNMTAGAGR